MKLLSLMLAAALPLVATASPEALPTAPPADARLALILAARGVQIYECRDQGWALVAPEAVLFDAQDRVVGTHGAGPVWEAADGSRIAGSVKARADAPAPGAIAWLLLATRSTGPQGLYSRVTSIQRVNTTGGVAPASGCSTATVGAIAKVPYTADYIFYKDATVD